jgi:hypothetical protein
MASAPNPGAQCAAPFGAALQLAGGIDDLGRGCARRHRGWVPLMRAVARNKRLSNGLAAFANWCSLQDLAPDTVDDAWVQRFLHWLETRSLHPTPRDLVRRVPNVWNEASAMVDFWPKIRLAGISYRHQRKRVQWSDLSESFRQDAEAYLALRPKPDLDARADARLLAGDVQHKRRAIGEVDVAVATSKKQSLIASCLSTRMPRRAHWPGRPCGCSASTSDLPPLSLLKKERGRRADRPH